MGGSVISVTFYNNYNLLSNDRSDIQGWLRAQQLDPDNITQEDLDVLCSALTRKATPSDLFVTNAASELIFLYRMGRVIFR